MKNNILKLTAVGFVLSTLAAGCGPAKTDPVEEAKKGAALAAEAKRAGQERAQQQR